MGHLQEALRNAEAAQAALTTGDKLGSMKQLVQGAEHYYLAALEGKGQERNERLEAAARMARLALDLRQKQPPAQENGHRAPNDDQAEGLTDFVPVQRPDTRFSDVVGLEEAKQTIDLALVRPLKHPEEAKRFGLKPGGGLLLYGPPGTGKTLLGRAVAGEVDAPFYYVKPAEVMSQWVGQAERNIARLFAEARRHERAVIFIDEVESLVPSRGSNRSTVMARVVPQILAEMEGFQGRTRGLMFIGATNRPEKLDEAMLRPGRFDRKLYIGPPNQDERRSMFDLNLRGRDVSAEVSLDDLARGTNGYTGADIANLCEQAARRAFASATTESDVERRLEMADLRAEIEGLRLSVTPRMLAGYEAFGRAS